MAGEPVAVRDRLLWQEAEIVAITHLTPMVTSVVLRPRQWDSFVAGQHVDIRLTAPDGYQAQRSYSIGSAPGSDTIELAIERLPEGEVSPFFAEVAQPGDSIELRGPIGGHFIWRPSDGGPLLLVAGGSGLVPLMAMARHRAAAASHVPVALIYSARRADEVIFRDELLAMAATDPDFALYLTLSREAAPVPSARLGRIDRALVDEALGRLGAPRQVFVCGSNGFVEAATMLLTDAGLPPSLIRTERFGGAVS